MKSCLPKAAAAATTKIKKFMDTALDRMPTRMQGNGEGRVLLAMMYFQALDRIPFPWTLLSNHKSIMLIYTLRKKEYKSWAFPHSSLTPIRTNILSDFSSEYLLNPISPGQGRLRDELEWEEHLKRSVDSAMARTNIAASSALSQADRVEVWKAECRGYIMGRRDGRLDEIFNTIQ